MELVGVDPDIRFCRLFFLIRRRCLLGTVGGGCRFFRTIGGRRGLLGAVGRRRGLLGAVGRRRGLFRAAGRRRGFLRAAGRRCCLLGAAGGRRCFRRRFFRSRRFCRVGCAGRAGDRSLLCLQILRNGAGYQSQQQRPVYLGKSICGDGVRIRQTLNFSLGAFSGQISVNQAFCLSQIELCLSAGIGIGCHILLQHFPGHLTESIQKCVLGRGGIHFNGRHHFLQISFQHGQDAVCGNIHAKGRGNRISVHRDHILKIQGGFCLLIEAASGKHIHFPVRKLGFDQLRFLCPLDHPAGQTGGIGNTGGKSRGIGTFSGTDNAHNLEGLRRFKNRFHMVFIIGHIFPDIVLLVILVKVRNIHQPQFQIQQVFVGPLFRIGNGLHILTCPDFVHDPIQQIRILQAQGIGHIVGNLTGVRQNNDHLIVFFRPSAPKHLILRFQKLPVIDHLIENIRCHVAGHEGIAHELVEEGCGICLENPFFVIPDIDPRFDPVAVFDGADGVVHFIIMSFQMPLEGFQVVGTDLGKHLGDHLLFHHHALISVSCLRQGRAKCRKHGAHI